MYDPYLLFWLGLPSMGYSCASQAPVLFLTLDRICALQYSSFFNSLRRGEKFRINHKI
jgi:hypothetical protein